MCQSKNTAGALELLNTRDCALSSGTDFTALMTACIYEMSEVALKILENEGGIDSVGDVYEDLTALIIACHHNLPEVIMKILEYNCCINYINPSGHSALNVACKHGLSRAVIHAICDKIRADVHTTTWERWNANIIEYTYFTFF